MVRLALVVVAVVGLARPTRAASDLPRRIGMYPAQGAALAMVDSKIAVQVRGPIAEVIVSQTFRNQTDRVTEATYIFPLPADAAVSAMEIETGARTIRAAIESRDQAQQRYERAVAAGIGAGLLDQERPDVFTQTVSAIPARGTVTITLRLDTVAQFSGGRWQLVLPMVVAPRYVPGTASGRPTTGTGRAPDTDRAPDGSRVTPGGAPGAGGKTEVALEFADQVDDVTSSTHEIAQASGRYTFTDAATDHDAVIRWRAKLPASGWVEASDDGGFAAVVVEAPPAGARKVALRVQLVLDRAATTRGDSDAVRRPLVRALLAALTAKDQVAVTGAEKIDWRAPDQVQRALDDSWSKPGGPFDLTKLLGQARGDGVLVLVSDGLVADDRAAIAAARKLATPIYVIGIGPAPNRSLLTAIANASGGTIRFATAGDDLTAIARDVLADAATPPQPLNITWGTLQATEVVPASVPRLGANQATLVIAKVRRVQSANARVGNDVFGFTAVTPQRPPDGATTARGALARRWAKLALDQLIAAGNPRAITDHALRYGLVSPYTSMVAIGDEVVVQGGVKHSVPVAVSVPAGMRWQLVRRELTVDTTRSGGLRDDAEKAEKTVRDDAAKAKNTVADRAINKPSATTPRPKKAEPDTGKRANRPSPAPAPAPQGATAPATTDHERAAEDHVDDNKASQLPRRYEAAPEPARSAPESSGGVATGDDRDADAGAGQDESAPKSMVNSLAETSAVSRRRLRLALAAGAGVAVVNGNAAAMGGLSGRIELGGRTRVGVEGSLWLVDGLHAQGSVLGSVRRSIGNRFELGAGAGVRITSDAVGPALDLTLRTRLPVRHLATYLRYDGALLLHDQTYDGQNVGSLGIEASW